MGKTTLYHPVSLHVIRGAAEYCGWQFGKIVQLDSDPKRKTARYRAEIAKIAPEVESSPSMVMLNDLDNCFAADIHAHWLRQTQSGQWMVDLVVDLNPNVPVGVQSSTHIADE